MGGDLRAEAGKTPGFLIFKEGLKASWPICVGYFPIGLAFGVLAQKAGLKLYEIGLMSVVVFAGSSQFVGVSMLSSGAGAMSIVLATFMINLRHLLMSSALAVHLRGIDRGFLSLFAYGVTDESFAVNLTCFRNGAWHPFSALVVNHISNAAWVVSTVVGGYGGRFIPPGSFGIDYALVAMFLCLLGTQIRGRLYALTAALSGVIAVGLSVLIAGNIHVIVASLVAATCGFTLRRAALRKGQGHA